MLFILGKTLSVMEKISFWHLCNKRPLGGLLNRGRLTQNSIQRRGSVRYGAFIGSWAFIRSFTVSNIFAAQRAKQQLILYTKILDFVPEYTENQTTKMHCRVSRTECTASQHEERELLVFAVGWESKC